MVRSSLCTNSPSLRHGRRLSTLTGRLAFAAGSPEAASDVVDRGGGAVGCDFAAKSVASMPAGVGHSGRPPGRVGRLSAVSPDP
jgi:hypothetical protein